MRTVLSLTFVCFAPGIGFVAALPAPPHRPSGAVVLSLEAQSQPIRVLDPLAVRVRLWNDSETPTELQSVGGVVLLECRSVGDVFEACDQDRNSVDGCGTKNRYAIPPGTSLHLWACVFRVGGTPAFPKAGEYELRASVSLTGSTELLTSPPIKVRVSETTDIERKFLVEREEALADLFRQRGPSVDLDQLAEVGKRVQGNWGRFASDVKQVLHGETSRARLAALEKIRVVDPVYGDFVALCAARVEFSARRYRNSLTLLESIRRAGPQHAALKLSAQFEVDLLKEAAP